MPHDRHHLHHRWVGAPPVCVAGCHADTTWLGDGRLLRNAKVILRRFSSGQFHTKIFTVFTVINYWAKNIWDDKTDKSLVFLENRLRRNVRCCEIAFGGRDLPSTSNHKFQCQGQHCRGVDDGKSSQDEQITARWEMWIVNSLINMSFM